jgi:hypothetical protein
VKVAAASFEARRECADDLQPDGIAQGVQHCHEGELVRIRMMWAAHPSEPTSGRPLTSTFL